MNGNQMNGEMNDVDYSISEKDKMLIKKFVCLLHFWNWKYFLILYKYLFERILCIYFSRLKH